MSYSGHVRNGDKIRLLNQYRIADSKNQHADPPLAGYLDTCGIVKTGDEMIDPSPPSLAIAYGNWILQRCSQIPSVL